MTDDKRAIIVGEARNARPHGDGVMVDLTAATIGQPEDDRAVIAVFTFADVAEILRGLPLERFSSPDSISLDEAIEALREGR